MASSKERDELIHDRNFRKTLFLIALKFTRREDISDDIAQETHLTLCSIPVKKLENIDDLKAYAVQIAKNKAQNWFNGEIGKHDEIKDDEEGKSGPTDPQIKVDTEIIMQHVSKKFNKEPDPAIFRLRLEEWPYRDIAEQVGKDEDYVKKRMFIMRNWIRKNFEK